MFHESLLRRCLLVLALVAVAGVPTSVPAQDAGEFEGAVWTIALKPRQPRSDGPLRATYRISDRVLYQKEKPRIPVYDKQVGRNYPNGKKTRTHFRELTAFTASREPRSLSGWANLQMDERGKWSGQFIDSTGKHWDCEVKRVQE